MSEATLNLAQRLARPELLDLEPYQSARRIGGRGDIWINANESPFNRTDLPRLNRYPECQPPALIAAYSRYVGIDSKHVVCSRGADEAIELLIRTFCIPGKDSIALFGPTYGMYSISARTFNVGVVSMSLTPEYGLPYDLSAVKGCKLVFICNPNNPTGTLIRPEKIESVLQTLPEQLVVVDEAYIEFSPEYSVVALLDKYPNLVILRTLSKAFALAGARCGFTLASADVVAMIMLVIAPYPVPLPVSVLAERALSEAGLDNMRADVQLLIQQGQRLADCLEQLGAKVLPTGANFVLAYFDDIQSVAQGLKDAGIVARAYKDPRLVDAIRFSYSDERETDLIIAALKKILN
ncbi:histidinol-phosphate transaminase [Shewanella yunxiaonensis]|uniref:Histidinol-phosphate aminotransferase n=1 Tax=Shewanella yunxiaonensis TaxID=2829809 RepID=A0ABX7YQ52_9GAMM|nr:histidinol-phosphate transaminase [Shewanella yunxiaonensis]QUN04535.1 histidinol-phosphate transaminase [Shewanella yunxiaonensis]